MGEKQRREQRIKELERQWELLSQKIEGLRKAHILETRFEEQFRLEADIDRLEGERERIDRKLRDLESQPTVSTTVLSEDGVEQDSPVREIYENTQHLLEQQIALSKQVSEGFAQLSMRLESSGLGASGALPAQDTAVYGGVEAALHAEIDRYRDLLLEKSPRTALRLLQTLKERIWETATDQIKFRLTANIAAAQFNLGDNTQAAQGFLEAERYNPLDEKAVCNAVLGHLLLEDWTGALAAAQRAVQTYPESCQVVAMLITASIQDKAVIDPEALVPAGCLDSSEVAYALADFYHRRQSHNQARRWMERALDLDNQNLHIRTRLGELLLHRLIEDPSIAVGGQFSVEQRADLEKAHRLLAGVWDEVKSTEVATFFCNGAINLSHTERLLGANERALQVIEEALRIEPDSPLLRRQKATIALEMGDAATAFAELAAVRMSLPPEGRLLYVHALWEAGRNEEALDQVEELIKTASDAGLLTNGQALRIGLLGEVRGYQAALEEAQRLIVQYPGEFRYRLALCRLYFMAGNRDSAAEHARTAMGMLTGSADYADRQMVADALFRLDLFSEAAAVYDTLVSSGEDTRNLRRLLICLIETDCRKSILERLNSLSEEVRARPLYLQVAAVLYDRIGDLAKARERMEAYLEQFPANLEMRLAWIGVLQRQGEQGTIEAFLSKPLDLSDAKADERIRLAQLLDRYGKTDEALQLAYETRCRFHNVPQAHLALLGLLVFRGKRPVPPSLHVTAIGVDTAFTVADDAGRRRTFIIEPGPARDSQAGEIAPDSPLAKNALGHRKGDRIIVAENAFQKDEQRVVDIKHKYVHALHESMEQFNVLFPDYGNAFASITLPKKSKGRDRFEPIFKAVSDRHDAVLRVEELYQQNGLPIGVVAKLLGVDPVETWCGLAASERVKLNCCLGTAPERLAAFKLIDSHPGGFVVDPITLYVICVLDIQEGVVAVTGRLGLVQSTLDCFNNLLEKRRVHTGGERMMMFKKDGQFYKQEISAQDVERSVRFLERVLAWALTKCDLLPAVGKTDLDQDGREVAGYMAPAFMDTLLAAQGANRILLSDDLHLRRLAKGLLNVNGVWLQPVLIKALRRKDISRDRYNEAIIAFINANYYFASIDAGVLLHAAMMGDWEATASFRQVAATLGGKDCDPGPATEIAGTFLVDMWSRPIPVWQREQLTFIVLNALARERGEIMEDLLMRVMSAEHNIQGPIALIQDDNQCLFLEATRKWYGGYRFFELAQKKAG